MNWTKNEKQVWTSIEKWEQDYFTYVPTDFGKSYGKALDHAYNTLSPGVKENVLQTVDNLLFHLHSIILNARFQQDVKDRILLSAQAMNPSIEAWEDIKECRIEQLRYIANHQVAKHRLLSFVQGGLSGAGGILFLGLDIPASIAAHIRSIQVLALSYGYSIHQPYETMLSLKVFYAASIPKQYQYEGWQQLMTEISDTQNNPYFFESEELVADNRWMRQLINMIGKGMVLFLLRKRLMQGVPLVGIAFGAAANYHLSRQITDFANQFYQKRWLIEKYY